MFSENIRQQFDKDGYLVLEGLLQEHECQELLSAGIGLTRNLPNIRERAIFSTTMPAERHHIDKYFLESNDKIRYFFENDALMADGTLKVDPNISLNKVGHALHLLHPSFRKYTYSDRIKTICKELMGLIDPAVVQSMYIYKNPGVGGEVIAHQDSTYLYTTPIPPIGFWIALEDATVENGCLWIAKGSHTSGVHRRLIRNPDQAAKEALIYDKPEHKYLESCFEPVPVKKGTCILLHGLVVHKSAHNTSAKSRHAYTFHVVEKRDNMYSSQNWLLEGPGAPFYSLYTTEAEME